MNQGAKARIRPFAYFDMKIKGHETTMALVTITLRLATLSRELFQVRTDLLRSGPLSRVLHACSHQHVVVPDDRLILGWVVLIRTRRQTFNHVFAFGAHEVRYRITFSSHTFVACESILFWWQPDTVDGGFQSV